MASPGSLSCCKLRLYHTTSAGLTAALASIADALSLYGPQRNRIMSEIRGKDAPLRCVRGAEPAQVGIKW